MTETKETRKTSDRKYKYDQEYFKENYAQVKLSMPKSEAEALNDYCERHDIKRATLIRQLIKEKIEQDN